MSTETEPPTGLDLDAIRRDLDEASGAIDAPDAQYDWAALQALRTAEHLLEEVERLKANQLPDGGEWQTWYGGAGAGGFDVERLPDDDRQYRVWTGPVEPIEANDG